MPLSYTLVKVFKVLPTGRLFKYKILPIILPYILLRKMSSFCGADGKRKINAQLKQKCSLFIKASEPEEKHIPQTCGSDMNETRYMIVF